MAAGIANYLFITMLLPYDFSVVQPFCHSPLVTTSALFVVKNFMGFLKNDDQ
jgi:hypothetical protein